MTLTFLEHARALLVVPKIKREIGHACCKYNQPPIFNATLISQMRTSISSPLLVQMYSAWYCNPPAATMWWLVCIIVQALLQSIASPPVPSSWHTNGKEWMYSWYHNMYSTTLVDVRLNHNENVAIRVHHGAISCFVTITIAKNSVWTSTLWKHRNALTFYKQKTIGHVEKNKVDMKTDVYATVAE